MSYPKLSQNGTSACQHFKQARAVEDACNALLEALEAATPAASDYAPIGPDSHWRAVNAHQGRILAVRGVRTHAQVLAQHVADQLEGKEVVAAAA